KAFAWTMWSEAGGLDFRRISFGLDFVLLRRKSPVRTRCSAPTLRESRSQSRQRAASAIAVANSVFRSPLRRSERSPPARSLAFGFPGEPDRWDLDARFELAARLPATESELLAGIVDHHPFGSQPLSAPASKSRRAARARRV